MIIALQLWLIWLQPFCFQCDNFLSKKVAFLVHIIFTKLSVGLWIGKIESMGLYFDIPFSGKEKA